MGYSFNCLPKFSTNIFLQSNFFQKPNHQFCPAESVSNISESILILMVQTRSGRKITSVQGISTHQLQKRKWTHLDQSETKISKQWWCWPPDVCHVQRDDDQNDGQNKQKLVQKRSRSSRRQKAKQLKKVLKLSKKHIQHEDTSDESESVGDTDEEYEVSASTSKIPS